ncbi:MAG TPA: Fe-S cluster assembly protein SufD [Chlamydiales bacterium]|nr:Fe-S cluster assembly protein SufD [Chlamydiales bacterium]
MLAETTKVDFQKQFEPHVFVEIESLLKVRMKAWERLKELGFPGLKSDAFQYMRLTPLLMDTFQKPEKEDVAKELYEATIAAECQTSFLLFVDGHFRKELSNTSGLPSSVVIEPLSKAMKTYGMLLQNSFQKVIKEEKDPFCLLNAAAFSDGLFIYVPPKSILSQPLQVIHILTQGQSFSMPRVHLFQGAHSEMTVVTTLMSEAENCFYNGVFDVAIEENAKLQLVQMAFDNGKKSHTSGWFFDALRSSLKHSSALNVVQMSDGSLHLRRDADIHLSGEGAEALLNGTWLLNENREAHTHVVIEHAAPYTHSNQLFKGVLNDSAHSSFQGKILVRKEAQKTEAYQLNKNLMLSDTTQANSKPNLEIFADDVKASHGSTMGQLEPEELFYLLSRGFCVQDARNALIAGFCQEVVNLIPLASLRQIAVEHIENYIEEKK